MGITPMNTVAGRRRLSQTPELPIVTVNIQAGSPDPEGLLANATAAFPMGGKFDTEVLPRYSLKMSAATEASPFGENAVTPSIGSSSSSTSSSSTNASTASSSSGLSGGAIAGIVIGCLAGVAIIGALAWIFVVKKNKNKNTQGHDSQDSPAGSASSGKFSTGLKDAANDDLA